MYDMRHILLPSDARNATVVGGGLLRNEKSDDEANCMHF